MRIGIRPGIRRLFRLAPRTTAAIRGDVDDEVSALIAARVDYLVARGMSPDDARVEALRRLGDSVEHARLTLHQSALERERSMAFTERVASVFQDIRYAARGLARRPGFTAVAVLTLAIGIGATTAIFSAVHVMLLRSLPYANADDLMMISLVPPQRPGSIGGRTMVWSYPKFGVFRQSQHVFSRMALYAGQDFTIDAADAERIHGEFVGAEYLRTLGLAPQRGQDFAPSVDDHPDAPLQVILSDALWQRRYNADPSIIGKPIVLDGEQYTIIGVGPRAFIGLSGRADVFIPVTTRHAKDDLDQAMSHEFFLVGRRGPGVSERNAEAAVATLGGVVNAAVPDAHGQWSAVASPLDDARTSPLVKRSLLILLAAVGFVLLIACVNVANLTLGRAAARRREIAVRLAIGASRGRLVRQLLTESLSLAALGAAAGIAVAWWGIVTLRRVVPDSGFAVGKSQTGLGAVHFADIALDWSVLGFALGVAVLVGLAFGLVPAIGAARTSLVGTIKGAGDDDGGGRPSSTRRVLVIAEVALAVILLTGSGLMIRSLSKLLAVDTGADPQHVLTLRLTVTYTMAGRDSMPAFYVDLLGRLRALPGVESASISNCPPLNGGCNRTVMDLALVPNANTTGMPTVGVNWVSPTWFATIRGKLVQGRVFTDADRIGAPKVVLVNQTAAKRFWPNESPLGKRLGVYQGGFQAGAEIVGVVADVRQWPDSAPTPDVYVPYLQSPRPGMIIFVRAQGDPAALTPSVRAALRAVAPHEPVYDVQTLVDRTAAATAQARFSAVLLGLFAATALALAIVGIYGVMSLAVAVRTRELGIRIALGADGSRVRWMVVGEGLALVSVGAAIGLAGAVLCTRVLRSMLFDLSPGDPATYVVVVLLLIGAAAVASWIPARRASSVDPMVALRSD